MLAPCSSQPKYLTKEANSAAHLKLRMCSGKIAVMSSIQLHSDSPQYSNVNQLMIWAVTAAWGDESFGQGCSRVLVKTQRHSTICARCEFINYLIVHLCLDVCTRSKLLAPCMVLTIETVDMCLYGMQWQHRRVRCFMLENLRKYHAACLCPSS